MSIKGKPYLISYWITGSCNSIRLRTQFPKKLCCRMGSIGELEEWETVSMLEVTVGTHHICQSGNLSVGHAGYRRESLLSIQSG